MLLVPIGVWAVYGSGKYLVDRYENYLVNYSETETTPGSPDPNSLEGRIEVLTEGTSDIRGLLQCDHSDDPQDNHFPDLNTPLIVHAKAYGSL